MSAETHRQEHRTSLLLELQDRAGALESVLREFSKYGVSLTHIESRPRSRDRFEFYVDCEVALDDPNMAALIGALEPATLKLLILDDQRVPWFPRHISELDDIANRTLDAGSELTADHPGFNDLKYRERRSHIDRLAREYRYESPFPIVDYTPAENETWRAVYEKLTELHARFACQEYLVALRELEQECGFSASEIPQGRDVSRFLTERTGFRIRPVAGLLSSRDFLNGLAFRVFFSTQYIRHQSHPLYTPEPDVCHELLGHAPMFANPEFADLSQEIGLASLGASEEDITRLARCYWHSVEFGLVEQNGQRKAYGAGLLSSFGELAYACDPQVTATDGKRETVLRRWEPAKAAEQDFPITEYQPLYFVADSLQQAKQRMSEFCKSLPRPFYARYNMASERIWVDRAVKRNPSQ